MEKTVKIKGQLAERIDVIAKLETRAFSNCVFKLLSEALDARQAKKPLNVDRVNEKTN